MENIYQQITGFVHEQIASNDFFRGGFLIAVMGALFASLRMYPSIFASWFRNRITLNVDITDDNDFYHWFSEWFGDSKYIAKKARSLTLSVDEDTSPGQTKINYSPAPGVHYFFYRWHLVRLVLARQELNEDSVNQNRKETLSIEIFARSRKIIARLIDDIKEYQDNKVRDKVQVYSYSEYDFSWYPLKPDSPRRPESLCLDRGMLQIIEKDIRLFHAREDWYTSRGLPWRRGYLFSGPPGNGKTSCVRVLATTLGLPICVIDLKGSGQRNLINIFVKLPKKAIILLEDIDCLFEERDKNESGVSFSGLLNAIDGIHSSDGRILIMTTNHPDKIDEALIRPGRCDMHVEFNNASQAQLECLFRSFYPDSSDVNAEKFSELAVNDISMAEAQNLLLTLQESYEKDQEVSLLGTAANRLEKLLEELT